MVHTHLTGDILPTELLLMIFEYCAGVDSGVCYGWIHVLFVCRLWHTVAMANPKLWTKITSNRGFQCTTELLRRSGAQPLDIYIPLVDLNTLPTVHLLFTQLGRARMLDLHIPYEYRDELKRALSSTTDLPLLKSLTLHATTGVDSTDIRLVDIFPHELPHLVNLDILADLNISGMLDTPNLKKLTIGHAPSDDYVVDMRLLAAEDFVSALCRMPHLCELTVGNVGLDRKSAIVEDAAEIPKLRKLTIHGPAEVIGRFFEIITVPSATSIALDIVLEDLYDANEFVFPVSELFRHADSSPKRLLGSLTVSGSKHNLVIEGSTTHFNILEPVELPHQSPADFRLSVTVSDDIDKKPEYMEELAQFLELIPLQGVHALNVIGAAAKDILIPVSIRKIVDHLAALAPNNSVYANDFRADRAVGEDGIRWQKKIPSLRKIRWSPFYLNGCMQ